MGFALTCDENKLEAKPIELGGAVDLRLTITKLPSVPVSFLHSLLQVLHDVSQQEGGLRGAAERMRMEQRIHLK